MYKKYFIAGIMACFASSAIANTKAPTVTLGGSLWTEYTHLSQKEAFKLDSSGRKLSQGGIVNDTKLNIAVNGAAHGLKYGGLIVLNTDTSISRKYQNSVGNQTMVFVENHLGRLEAGDYLGVATTMIKDGVKIGAGTGGTAPWSHWVDAFNRNVGIGTYFVSSGVVTDVDGSYSLYTTKVTYYTPKIGNAHNNIQAGISYIPDSDQHGTISQLKGISKNYSSNNYYGVAPAGQVFGYKNAFQGGLAYNGKSGDVTFGLGLAGEIGDAKKLFNVTSASETVNRHKARAYEFSGNISYKGVTLASSFGSWGKSGMYKNIVSAAGVTTPIANAKSGSYWTAGARYDYNALGASVGYIAGKNGGFTGSATAFPTIASPEYSATRAVSKVLAFSMDYKLAPGFMPYAEVVLADLHDKSQGSAATARNKGSVFLAGTALQF
ncbi:MAG: hypothetical protein LW825_04020 [Candidatus Jidaibacter sp.]|jgi:hypothetical protein|nr:hypothetical protein [Candidatus Jidaibacter sp.]